MAKTPLEAQRNLFESEQEHTERIAKQAKVVAAMGPKPLSPQWFPGISNDYYDAIVLKANQIKVRIELVYELAWECWEDQELLNDLKALWCSYSFQINILMMYNPRGICEVADKSEEEIKKLVSRMDIMDNEGDDIREYLRRYELLCDQCVILGGQPN